MVDASIVMPCLNERQSLGHCIAVAQQALAILKERHDLTGEIVIADNGSTDGSQELAERLGARVVNVRRRGYGAALTGGLTAAQGRYLIMGDADGSYDFLDAVPMVEALMNGADLCMGSRFKGGIESGAMPWKNRYIGNPILTGILNLLFRAKIDDAHCGLRALTVRCFGKLRLDGSGMEFASEMVIKAALLKQTIVEVPVTLHRDLRDRPPHLRPWRDGWRHLRFLLMLSPSWLFAIPAAVLGAISLTILLVATTAWALGSQSTTLGNYWTILAGSTLTLSHIGVVLGLTGQLYGIQENYRSAPGWLITASRWLTLETMLIAGVVAIIGGFALLASVLIYWAQHVEPIGTVLPVVVGTSAIAIGVQNVLGGFLLAIVGGNEANFMQKTEPQLDDIDAPVTVTESPMRERHVAGGASQ